ncbi:MAG: tRNA pseudouridine(55) synthase TruB [Pseudomonadota bacterium]
MSVQSRRRTRRAIDGVLLLDKPYGITSQAAVTRAKTQLSAAKTGHTGTLDPMATGLLPLAFGEATKFAQTLLNADKGYFATVRLGTTTSTGDLEGEVLSTQPVNVDRAQIETAVAQFRGEIEQMPPMYSALKHAGKPLYEYARAGTEIARCPRRITITALEIEAWEADNVCLRIECSKGTYVRVLAEDIGRALGCGATLAALRRTGVGRFLVEDAVTLEAWAQMNEEQMLDTLLPVDALLAGVPSFELDAEQSRRMRLGQAVELRRTVDPGLVRVYGPGSYFLGVADASPEGRLLPRRMVSTCSKA